MYHSMHLFFICIVFFGRWLWNVIGPGTLFAMLYVGHMVKIIIPHMGWFERLLASGSHLPRHIFGLARFIYPRR